MMSVTGINTVQTNLAKMEAKYKQKLKNALESVLSEMVSWIKNNHDVAGGWSNQSGNLEQSIDYSIDTSGGTLVGIIYAGPEYAIHVEFMEGHWVISGAISEYKNKILKLIADRINES